MKKIVSLSLFMLPLMAMWSLKLNAAVSAAQSESSDSGTVVVHAP